MSEIKYTKHDLDTVQRISVIETKIDVLSEKLDDKFNNIDENLKNIIKHQNKSLTINDAFNFSKKNYKLILVVIIFLTGGDFLRQKTLNWFFDILTSTSSAQEIPTK